MNQLSVIGLASFGIAVFLTPIFRDIFRSYKVLDQPDARKVHVYPIPRVGGIAIVIAYFCAFYLPGWIFGQPLDRELTVVTKILPAGLLVFATGLIDDFWGLRPSQKFVGQFAAAMLAWWAGVRIEGIAGFSIPGIWSFPITTVWIVVCTNAFNLVDGLDGLAAGVGLFATLTIFGAAILQGNEPLAYATLPLAGCLIGFLCFNLNPATVFLGDCGSLLIGFLLGCFGAVWSQKSLTLIGLTAPLMAVSIPLIDVTLCIIRRWLRAQPIFSADRGHIHHKLLDRGLTPRQAVFLLYGVCGLAAGFSLVQTFVANVYVAGAVVAGFVVLVWVGVHKLGYIEFVLAGRLLRFGELQRNVSATLTLSSLEASILKAQTLDDCWRALVNARITFGFAAVRMQIERATYEEWPVDQHERAHWTIRLPLSGRGNFIEFAREFGNPTLPMTVVPFTELVAAALSSRLAEISGAHTETADARLTVQQGRY